MALFEDEPIVDESPLDSTTITTILLYLDKPQAEEFKKRCKAGMMQMYPTDFREKSISQFLFDLVKNTYE